MSSAERDIFSELFWKIRNLRYVPQESEMKVLRGCEAEAYRRAGVSSAMAAGATLGASLAFGVFKSRRGASIGIALCNAALAGYYGARSTSSYCLESLTKLETPMGGELAVIFARRCPECDVARSSPWADAIRGMRGRPPASAFEGESGAYQELDISPRIATPEALAALREERRVTNQQAVERGPPRSRRHVAREAAMEVKAAGAAGRTGDSQENDVFGGIFGEGGGSGLFPSSQGADVLDSEGPALHYQQQQGRRRLQGSQEEEKGEWEQQVEMEPRGQRRRRGAHHGVGDGGEGFPARGRGAAVGDQEEEVALQQGPRRRRRRMGLGGGEEGDMNDPWASADPQQQQQQQQRSPY